MNYSIQLKTKTGGIINEKDQNVKECNAHF